MIYSTIQVLDLIRSLHKYNSIEELTPMQRAILDQYMAPSWTDMFKTVNKPKTWRVLRQITKVLGGV